MKPIGLAISIALATFCILIVIRSTSLLDCNVYINLGCSLSVFFPQAKSPPAFGYVIFSYFQLLFICYLGNEVKSIVSQNDNPHLCHLIFTAFLLTTERSNVVISVWHAMVHLLNGSTARHCTHAESNTNWMYPHHWPIVRVELRNGIENHQNDLHVSDDADSHG